MNILVTGTAGFIGFHLVRRLVSEGYMVTGLDSINEYYDVNLKYDRLSEAGIDRNSISYNSLVTSTKFPNYNFIQLNLEDQLNLQELFKNQNFDIVINLAAQTGVRYSLINPEVYIQSNINGFFNLLECCRKYEPGHFIFASSSSVYGLNKKMPFSTTDHTDHPVSLYAATKKSNELLAHTYSHLFKLHTTGLRFFTVYGPWGRPDMAYYIFTKNILNNLPVKVHNYGNMLRDFTYIDDIVESISRIIPIKPNPADLQNLQNYPPQISSAPYHIYNIGNHNPVKLIDFIKCIEDKLEIKAIKELSPIQPGDVTDTFADVEELVNTINFKPNTSLKTGISNFIDWYRVYYKI